MTMGISLKPEHLKRYKDIALLLMKYGRSDMVKHFGLDALDVEEPPIHPAEKEKAAELAHDLEKLGPTFIKLGQLLSTRVDLVPVAYTEALARLQDKTEPFPFAQVEAIVQAELGLRISKAFSQFEPVPLASASLGQVHRAAMRDGRVVVVKVQRPGIRETIAQDMEALEEIVGFLHSHSVWAQRYNFVDILNEFRKSLWRELDYREEVRNLTVLSENLADFSNIIVPAPIPDYCTSRVLTMEFIRGRKITDITPLGRLEVNGAALAEDLFEAYLKQILVDGFFHADPHPGNVFLTNDGRIALLDLGMVGRISPRMQEDLLRLLMYVTSGRGEDAATVAVKIGSPDPDFNEQEFRKLVVSLATEHQNAKLQHIQVGRVVLAITQGAANSGLKAPAEMTMLGKTLLNLDIVGQTLHPEFNPAASVQRNSEKLIRQRMFRDLSPANMIAGLLEVKSLLSQLPARMNMIFDALSRNEFRVKVDTIDETELVQGFQKVANRITLGLVLAALIVGASLLMRVETKFKLFGYPGLAMICFLIAAGSGLILVLNILFNDRRAKR